MLILVPWKPVLLPGACWQRCCGLDTLAIRFWKERTPLRWRSTIRIAFRHTALLITELAIKATQTDDHRLDSLAPIRADVRPKMVRYFAHSRYEC